MPLFYEELTGESDALFLDPRQSALINQRQADFAPRLAAHGRALAQSLAALPSNFDVTRVAATVETATDEAWEMSRLEARLLREFLTPIQQQLLPSTTRMLVTATGPVRQSIRYY